LAKSPEDRGGGRSGAIQLTRGWGSFRKVGGEGLEKIGRAKIPTPSWAKVPSRRESHWEEPPFLIGKKKKRGEKPGGCCKGAAGWPRHRQWVKKKQGERIRKGAFHVNRQEKCPESHSQTRTQLRISKVRQSGRGRKTP